MDGHPRALMLGMGWFPSTLGGLDRYYRALFEQLPGSRGVVIGPAEGAPAAIEAVAAHDVSLVRRLSAYWRAARRAAPEADLIDAHFALYAAAPLLLGRGRPSVFHFHGPWAEENAASSDSSRLRFVLRRALERRVLAAADAHVVLSHAFGRVLLERYGVAPWGLYVWPPGVDLERFTPGDRERARAAIGLEPEAFAAVCVRRLVARMGIDVLLEAWASSQVPPGSRLLVVGDGPLAAELAERISHPDLAGRVELLGRVSDERLADLYRAADVAVVPTVSVEGFGMVVLEAAACGTPSIVTDVGGLREAAAPLDPSLVVAAGDPEALGRRLAGAAAGALPDRAAARAHAELHSWTRLGERHRELYGRLAARASDTRPRVVFVDHVARLSGGEIAMLRLLPQLQGVRPHVILGEEGPLAGRLQGEGVSVEVLALGEQTRDLRKDAVGGGAGAARAAVSTVLYALRLARRLRRLRPDAVHANSLKSGVYGGIAAKLARVPLVWHLRDRIAPDYLPRPAVAMMRLLVAALADRVIANSDSTLATLPARARRRGVVIPDSVRAEARPPGRIAATATFGMLGRIAPWKGQDLFLRAFAEAFPGGPERAAIVGVPMFGEEDFERELQRLAAELGLADRVEFRGFREDVWSELASFDVLVHASVIPEPFGQVVLEGMAAGVAVAAANEGGPADVVEDGRTGLLFASRDTAALAATLRRLRDDRGLREALGAAAREAARAYDPEILAERWRETYDLLPLRRAQGSRRGGR